MSFLHFKGTTWTKGCTRQDRRTWEPWTQGEKAYTFQQLKYSLNTLVAHIHIFAVFIRGTHN